MLKTINLLVLPGDGVGPEVVSEALKLLDIISSNTSYRFNLLHSDIGGCCIDKIGVPIMPDIKKLLSGVDAVLLGAVGGLKWDKVDKEIRPEKGLLQLRESLCAFANYRPAILNASLAHASSLKEYLVKDLDILIIRELVSGIYFGEPRGIEINEHGIKRAFNTMAYNETEIARIGHLAFKAARLRGNKLCSVDKANVLEVSMLWREIIDEISVNYPDVELEHMYVDNAAMQLVKNPKKFDVIVTGNLFGDILSDCAAMLTGSIGMLPSASLNEEGVGIYEPVHGSAPDIAGKGVANPMAMILSIAMMFEFSLNDNVLSRLIKLSVAKVLEQGYRTADLCELNYEKKVSTVEMGNLVANAVQDELVDSKY
ncbi:MAG: 3-isopropylmalate dehydrogenase [Francisellaceae bacterium]|jgi:3-isopropylmalate dehydrogenase|nr:3-isopropylmalate dehydrogenase [Francisellaceae bacterium]MBT6207567.1 3-isopropylmalate dehydrogenase [Francisellaceae bacterium]MBT6538935.1 3-isopropylmalate dehydrogenase [Francisellaceae bacterium]